MTKSICVYCGANAGVNPVYAEAARALARALVDENIALVYGGGNVGLMGVIADEVLRLGGEVTGVIPTALVEREVGHTGLTRQFIVKDMHERKAMLTWSQLGIHAKPIGLLNVEGFYDSLVGFIAHAKDQGFIRPAHAALMMVETAAEPLLQRMRAQQA